MLGLSVKGVVAVVDRGEVTLINDAAEFMNYRKSQETG